jgi:hypothetical protein
MSDHDHDLEPITAPGRDSRPAGYHLGSLGEARARFVDAMNGIPMPWQPLPPRES